MIQKRVFCVVLGVFFSFISGRSIFRPRDPFEPYIVVRYKNAKKHCKLYSYHLSKNMFVCFDKDFFEEHTLPQNPISFRRDPTKAVDPHILEELLQSFIEEIKCYNYSRHEFEHFIILKSSDFSWLSGTGSLIVKFRNYPFVAKIFIKTPISLTQPYDEGFVQGCCFVIGGGMNRHISGFTRIKNLGEIKALIENHPSWSKTVDVPRKWFWQPRNNQWIEIFGYNIGPEQKQYMCIPATYAIICDAIETESSLKIWKKSNRRHAIEISLDLQMRLDPHIDNFVLEKDTGLWVIIDTEHFPTMVGLRRPLEYGTYTEYFLRLTNKYIHEKFFMTKEDRRLFQLQELPDLILC